MWNVVQIKTLYLHFGARILFILLFYLLEVYITV